jgi:hypothetical protein
VVLAEELEARAIEHSVARGLVRPFVVARSSDLHVPFATAFWVRDGHGRRLGMVLQRDAGVILEFDALEHEPGTLPPEGIAGLLGHVARAAHPARTPR